MSLLAQIKTVWSIDITWASNSLLFHFERLIGNTLDYPLICNKDWDTSYLAEKKPSPIRYLLLKLKDGIICVVRLAERRPISRTDPKFALIPKQEEHEKEDGSDGGSPGQVDVQVDGQVAVGVEQPGQLLGLLHEDIVVDQILDCAQDTGCGHP